MNSPTNLPEDFAGLCAEGVRLYRDLKRLELEKKLTGAAFLEAAMCHAEISTKRLAKVEEAIRKHQSRAVEGFINTVARVYCGTMPCYPIPIPSNRFPKAINAYGSAETMAELAACQISIGEALAVAAKHAVERFPDAFGAIENWQSHVDQIALARDRYESLLQQLQRSYTADDLEMGDVRSDRKSKPPTEAEIKLAKKEGRAVPEMPKGGVTRVWFKICPSVHPGMHGWPGALIEYLDRTTPPEVEKANGIARKRLSPEIEVRI